MMKFLLFFLFILFINSFINKLLMQLIFQNLIYILLFMMIIFFPLNNLNMWLNLYYFWGMDFYSLGLIILSLWILSLMLMNSGKIMFNSSSSMLYMYLMIFLGIILFICFISINLMMFYFFFEISLIPVFLLIMGWGGYVERLQAGFYMMLYTLFGSMPLFLMILMLFNMENSLMMDLLNLTEFSFFIYLSLILAFLVKMPIYMLHLWLPKAHVEAPVTGSMILAGVMLKLGSYGLMRVMLIMMDLCLSFNKFFIVFSIMGGLISSLLCLCQVDMKMLVAYSSVVHMSLLISGMMTMFSWGFNGGYFMMIAHGLCSSAMFCLVNINYERFYSRSLYLNKGMINLFPSLSFMWFLIISSNLSFPPSLNLFSEILLFNSLVMWNKSLIFILVFISFFSASYSLFLYSYTQHGKLNSLIYSVNMICIMEFTLLLLHWMPLNLFFFIMYMFI
nr:NADH deshydrogenase subunit 4 [Odontocolon albotibiale]